MGKRLVAAALVLVTLVALGQPAHAQPSIGTRTDQASYIPGGSGTLVVSVINTQGTGTFEIRNLTIYFPWAQLVDGKWPSSGANITVNLNPWVVLGSVGSNNNIYTYSAPFNVPTWYGGSIGTSCPGPNGPRIGLWRSCVIVGFTDTPRPDYEVLDGISITMAFATYAPTSLVTYWLSIATFVVLVIATAFLALMWSSLRRTGKKA